MSSQLLTAVELRALKRPVVQKLAKVCVVFSCVFSSVVPAEHLPLQREGIRANGKTEDIIAALLDVYPNGVEP